MSFIFKTRAGYYVAIRIKRNEKWGTKIIRKATKEEIEAYLEQRKQDNVTVVCDNPYCDKQFQISREQKIFLNTLNPRHRNTFEFWHCSNECRNAHLTALGVNKS